MNQDKRCDKCEFYFKRDDGKTFCSLNHITVFSPRKNRKIRKYLAIWPDEHCEMWLQKTMNIRRVI